MVSSYFPQRLGDRGSVFRWWVEQIASYLGSLDFLRQALQMGRVRAILEMQDWAIRNYVSICSSLYSQGWGQVKKRAQRSLVKVCSRRESLSDLNSLKIPSCAALQNPYCVVWGKKPQECKGFIVSPRKKKSEAADFFKVSELYPT
jgi:hypothetical protein